MAIKRFPNYKLPVSNEQLEKEIDEEYDEDADDPFGTHGGIDGNMDDEPLESGEDVSFVDEFGIEEGEQETTDFDLGELEEAELSQEYEQFESMEDNPEEFSFSKDESPQDIFKMGLTYEDQGAFAVAAKAYKEALDRGYNSAEVKSHLGWVTYCSDPHNDGFDKGATILQDVIKSDPHSHFPYLYLGKIYEEENDQNMAELYYIKALEMNRDCEEAKNNIKRLYESR